MSVNDAAPYLAGLPIAALAIDASERVVAMNPVRTVRGAGYALGS